MNGGGQVVVEVLLILPVFLWLVFVIMEIGYLSYRMIILQHMAYEVARVGSLTGRGEPGPGCPQPQPDRGTMAGIIDKMAGASAGQLAGLKLDFITERTLMDPQENCDNFDLVVTLEKPMPLVFPMTGLLLGTNGTKSRLVAATVRMPMEKSLFGGEKNAKAAGM